VRLWRVLPIDERAAPDHSGGALWFPRELQGYGRHDNPEVYGCIYAAEDPVSAVAEQLAPFRGTGPLLPAMLVRAGVPLALAGLDLADGTVVVDLDDPLVLDEHGLRPSQVATRHRTVTQIQASEIHASDPAALGLRWWSTLEASWINWTLFDRAAKALDLSHVEGLDLNSPVVREAVEFLGFSNAAH
jgi:RES domain-containing protein